jgi:hypothetical protein
MAQATLKDCLVQWLKRPALSGFSTTPITVKILAFEGKFILIADHTGSIHALLPPSLKIHLPGEKCIFTIDKFSLCMHESPSGNNKSDPFFLLKVKACHRDEDHQHLPQKPSTQLLKEHSQVISAIEALRMKYNKQNLFILLERVTPTTISNSLVALQNR